LPETSGDKAQDSKPRDFHFVALAKDVVALALTRLMSQRFGGHL
jgi:hypothetical protein